MPPSNTTPLDIPIAPSLPDPLDGALQAFQDIAARKRRNALSELATERLKHSIPRTYTHTHKSDFIDRCHDLPHQRDMPRVSANELSTQAALLRTLSNKAEMRCAGRSFYGTVLSAPTLAEVALEAAAGQQVSRNKMWTLAVDCSGTPVLVDLVGLPAWRTARLWNANHEEFDMRKLERLCSGPCRIVLSDFDVEVRQGAGFCSTILRVDAFRGGWQVLAPGALPPKLPAQWLNEALNMQKLDLCSQHSADVAPYSKEEAADVHAAKAGAAQVALRAFYASPGGERAFRALQNMAQALIKLGHLELALVHAQAATKMHTTAGTQDDAWRAWQRSAHCAAELRYYAGANACIKMVQAERTTPEFRAIVEKVMTALTPFHWLFARHLSGTAPAYSSDMVQAAREDRFCRGEDLMPAQFALLDELLAHNAAETAAGGEWAISGQAATEGVQQEAMRVAKERFDANDYRGALRVWRWALHQAQLTAQDHSARDGAATFLRDCWRFRFYSVAEGHDADVAAAIDDIEDGIQCAASAVVTIAPATSQAQLRAQVVLQEPVLQQAEARQHVARVARQRAALRAKGQLPHFACAFADLKLARASSGVGGFAKGRTGRAMTERHAGPHGGSKPSQADRQHKGPPPQLEQGAAQSAPARGSAAAKAANRKAKTKRKPRINTDELD